MPPTGKGSRRGRGDKPPRGRGGSNRSGSNRGSNFDDKRGRASNYGGKQRGRDHDDKRDRRSYYDDGRGDSEGYYQNDHGRDWHHQNEAADRGHIRYNDNGEENNYTYENSNHFEQKSNTFEKFKDNRERQAAQNQYNWMRPTPAAPKITHSSLLKNVYNEPRADASVRQEQEQEPIPCFRQNLEQESTPCVTQELAQEPTPVQRQANTPIPTITAAPESTNNTAPSVTPTAAVVAVIPTIAIKQEKIQASVKQKAPPSSSSSSSSSEDDKKTTPPAAAKLKQQPLKPIEKPRKSSSSSDQDSSSEEDKNPKSLPPKVTKVGPGFTETTIQIKKEKPRDAKKIVKKPLPSSSSSSSSAEDDETAAPAAAKLLPTPTKSKVKEIGAKLVVEKNLKPGGSSSSASDEDSSSEEEDETKKRAAKVEADVVCLGELQNKFTIEDDDGSIEDQEHRQQQVAEADSKKSTGHKCGICDKISHNSFQCQMVCKNCSLPYHNMKSCPRPANLTVMLQSFMEFCMQQTIHFNPDQRFPFNYTHSSVVSPASPAVSSVTSSKRTRTAFKSKEVAKKSAKKKRKKSRNKSYHQEDEEDETATTSDSTYSESGSESSKELKPATTKHKKKRAKLVAPAAPTAKDAAYAAGPFALHSGVAPYANLPNFVPAAGYNPMLFSQMMHSAFPAHAAMNFKS